MIPEAHCSWVLMPKSVSSSRPALPPAHTCAPTCKAVRQGSVPDLLGEVRQQDHSLAVHPYPLLSH